MKIWINQWIFTNEIANIHYKLVVNVSPTIDQDPYFMSNFKPDFKPVFVPDCQRDYKPYFNPDFAGL